MRQNKFLKTMENRYVKNYYNKKQKDKLVFVAMFKFYKYKYIFILYF